MIYSRNAKNVVGHSWVVLPGGKLSKNSQTHKDSYNARSQWASEYFEFNVIKLYTMLPCGGARSEDMEYSMKTASHYTPHAQGSCSGLLVYLAHLALPICIMQIKT